MDTGLMVLLAGVGVWLVYLSRRKKQKPGAVPFGRVVFVQTRAPGSHFLKNLVVVLVLVGLLAWCSYVNRLIPPILPR